MRLASAKMLWTAEARRMSVMNAVSIKRFLFVLKMNIIQILRSVGWAPENILCALQIFSAPQKYLLRSANILCVIETFSGPHMHCARTRKISEISMHRSPLANRCAAWAFGFFSLSAL